MVATGSTFGPTQANEFLCFYEMCDFQHTFHKKKEFSDFIN